MAVIPGIVAISQKTVPGTPSAPTATDVGTSRAYDNGAATVSYTEPTYTGRLPITQYSITGSPGGSATDTDGSPATVTGLDTSPSGTNHTFTVAATNAIGNSAASSASSSTLITSVPNTMTAPTATRTNNTTVSIAYTTPNTGGKSISSYRIVSSPSVTESPWTSTDLTTPLSITGTFAAGTPAAPTGVSGTIVNTTTVDVNFTAPSTPNGTSYTFTIAGTNANGTGTASTASTGIPINNEAITSYTVEARETVSTSAFSITRSDPADLTSPIRVTGSFSSSGGTIVAPTIGTPLVVGQDTVDVYFTPPTTTGGTSYQFRLRANNSNNGTFSSWSSGIVPNPGTITGYSIQSNPSITLTYSGSDTSSPVNVTGAFATNTTYTFRVAAIVGGVTGTYSSYSGSVTPDPRKLCTSVQITVGCCTATTTCGFYGAGTNCTTITGTFEAGAC